MLCSLKSGTRMNQQVTSTVEQHSGLVSVASSPGTMHGLLPSQWSKVPSASVLGRTSGRPIEIGHSHVSVCLEDLPK